MTPLGRTTLTGPAGTACNPCHSTIKGKGSLPFTRTDPWPTIHNSHSRKSNKRKDDVGYYAFVVWTSLKPLYVLKFVHTTHIHINRVEHIIHLTQWNLKPSYSEPLGVPNLVPPWPTLDVLLWIILLLKIIKNDLLFYIFKFIFWIRQMVNFTYLNLYFEKNQWWQQFKYGGITP
jgi:hypothetical protein